MRYYSTRGEAPIVDFERALFDGLAPDGGLYYPTRIPQLDEAEVERLRAARDELAALPFLQEVAFTVLHPWLGDDVGAAALRALVRDAQDFPTPLRRVGDLWVLEMFHGPTMAFKDVAARHLARLMSLFLERRGARALLLVATSGDTGGAIAHGFADQPNIEVVVLFPKGRISRLQEEQLTRVAPNVTPLAVLGDFDDCQAMVKRAFTDPRLKHLPLTSANSINVARLIPQIIPYAYAYFTLDRPDLEIVVPSGNFGNLTAGLFARAMGLPLDAWIAATNRNDAVARYYQSGRYEPAPTEQTLSTAMDVGNPSNFRRVLELFDHQYGRVREVLRAFAVSDAETVATMRAVYEQHGYALCPHSAVGWHVATHHGRPDRQQVVVATASPEKFAQEIREAAGLPVDDAAHLARLRQRPKREQTIPNRFDALAERLLELDEDQARA